MIGYPFIYTWQGIVLQSFFVDRVDRVDTGAFRDKDRVDTGVLGTRHPETNFISRSKQLVDVVIGWVLDCL